MKRHLVRRLLALRLLCFTLPFQLHISIPTFVFPPVPLSLTNNIISLTLPSHNLSSSLSSVSSCKSPLPSRAVRTPYYLLSKIYVR